MYFMTTGLLLHSLESNLISLRQIFNGTQGQMQLDIFIPKLKLAFEYHGEQHYLFHYLYGDPAKQQARDAEKKEKCLQAGITVIEVPYWWDRYS